MTSFSAAADRLNRLNGWQRACLILSLLWSPIVCFLRYTDFPTEEKWYAESRDESFEVKRELMKEADKHISHCRQITDILEQAMCFQASKPSYDRAVARASVEADERLRWGQKHIADDLAREQQKTIAIAVALWLGPIVVLYVVGILAAWVLRGFRAS